MSHTYSPKTAPIYQLKITLDGITPAIWRRFLVSSNITLDRLHDSIQIVMGWTNSHLHMFEIKEQIFGDPQDDEFGEMGTLDETQYRLRKAIEQESQRLRYDYDFGDGWRHTLLLEEILPPDPSMRLPVCLKGKRACPPEDVGGIGGYAYYLEALRNPKHTEHEEYLAWSGGEFDPEAFDLDLVNQRLRNMKSSLNAWQIDEYPSSPVDGKNQAPQPPALNEEQRQAVEALPLRRDVLTLLNYFKANRVAGTQSTGNLPLKAIQAICDQFVYPPQLETRIGKRVFRMRSEDDVWSLFFIHVLASVGRLVAGGPGRRWQVTSVGEKFMTAPAEAQIWLLFQTWWTQVNWGIATAYAPEDFPPTPMRQIILEQLCRLPLEHSLPYDAFADQVIGETHLSWHHWDGSQERSILHRMIMSTVVEPLSRFGILALEYRAQSALGADFRELDTIILTALGKSLLDNAMERKLSQ